MSPACAFPAKPQDIWRSQTPLRSAPALQRPFTSRVPAPSFSTASMGVLCLSSPPWLSHRQGTSIHTLLSHQHPPQGDISAPQQQPHITVGALFHLLPARLPAPHPLPHTQYPTSIPNHSTPEGVAYPFLIHCLPFFWQNMLSDGTASL